MSAEPLRLGISTCPNDTFGFHALMTGQIDTRGLAIDVELDDIEELNRGMFAGRRDASKVSFHAAAMSVLKSTATTALNPTNAPTAASSLTSPPPSPRAMKLTIPIAAQSPKPCTQSIVPEDPSQTRHADSSN